MYLSQYCYRSIGTIPACPNRKLPPDATFLRSMLRVIPALGIPGGDNSPLALLGFDDYYT